MTEDASGPSRECGPTCLHTCTVQPTAYSADSVECLFKNMELYSFLRGDGGGGRGWWFSMSAGRWYGKDATAAASMIHSSPTPSRSRTLLSKWIKQKSHYQARPVAAAAAEVVAVNNTHT